MGVYESKAVDLAEKYETSNPFNICENMGVNIEYVDLDNPLGDTIYFNKSPIILLSSKLQEQPEKFLICAHELGHVVLHNGIQNYYMINRTTKRKMESEADRFAMGLLEKFSMEEFGVPYNYFKNEE